MPWCSPGAVVTSWKAGREVGGLWLAYGEAGKAPQRRGRGTWRDRKKAIGNVSILYPFYILNVCPSQISPLAPDGETA